MCCPQPKVSIHTFTCINVSDAKLALYVVMVSEEVKHDDYGLLYGVGNEIVVAAAVVVVIVLVGYKLLSWAMPGNAPPHGGRAPREHVGIPGERHAWIHI